MIELGHNDKKLLEKYINTELFSMTNCGLISLKHIPDYPKLNTVALYNLVKASK